MPARIVAFSGNTHRPSRTRTLVEAVAAELSRLRPIDLKVYDLVDAGTGIAVASRSALPLPAARIVEALESADALIVGSWYKRDGVWVNPPDRERAKALIASVDAAR